MKYMTGLFLLSLGRTRTPTWLDRIVHSVLYTLLAACLVISAIVLCGMFP